MSRRGVAHRKGAEGENFWLPLLQDLFGRWQQGADGEPENTVRRRKAGATKDLGDYIGVPWLHEAKFTDVPHFLQWCKEADAKVPSKRWVVMWKGDLRRKDGPFVMMHKDFYEELVRGYGTQFIPEGQ